MSSGKVYSWNEFLEEVMINGRKTIAHLINCVTHDGVPSYGMKVSVNFGVVGF
jgi:hypothetical protein